MYNSFSQWTESSLQRSYPPIWGFWSRLISALSRSSATKYQGYDCSRLSSFLVSSLLPAFNWISLRSLANLFFAFSQQYKGTQRRACIATSYIDEVLDRLEHSRWCWGLVQDGHFVRWRIGRKILVSSNPSRLIAIVLQMWNLVSFSFGV